MNRREFMAWVGVGSVASSLPMALAACTPKGTEQATPTTAPTTAQPARTDGFQAIGTTADLDSAGELLSQQSKENSALVIRNPTDPTQLIAVNPTCPHAGCVVDWKSDQQAFLCPCHGSKFAADGKVLEGPSSSPLPTYAVKQEGDQVLVKTS
jgi:cytochrome b6-f complex iron-sulfur subunit